MFHSRSLVSALSAWAISSLLIAALPAGIRAEGSYGVTASSLPTPPAHPGAENLILNGSFERGAGNVPDQWRTEAWDQEPSATRYRWKRTPDHAGEIEIDNLKANDARFVQNVVLAEGWYYISAEMRTEDVASGIVGATISIMEDTIISPSLNGTQGWVRTGFYLKVGPKGANVEVACRLGGYSAMNKGRAFFRDVRAEKIDAPPQGARPVYDLEAARKSMIPKPVGRPWTLVATFMVLAAIAVLGWRNFGEPAPERPRLVKSKRRRQ